MSRNLLTDPCWTADDLGVPLPDSNHATSVALPCWDHAVGYEEGRPEIVSAMQLGYPRFVLHPQVAELFSVLEKRYGRAGERCFAFPSEEAADRCVLYLMERGWLGARRELCPETRIHGVFFPEAAFRDAKSFWQHFGKIISSRRAEAALEGREAAPGGAEAKRIIRERIGAFLGEPAEHVWLYPSGMAAMSRAMRLVQDRRPGAKSIQLGFPYVDVFKVQTVSGPGSHFVGDYNLDAVAVLLDNQPISAIVCEFPGNPLLAGCGLPRLAALAHAHDVPLIIDDTAATYANVNVFPHADLVVTSLTKAFSGEGDVMAGGLAVHGAGPFGAAFAAAAARNFDDLFWDDDALVLEQNSRDFEARVFQSNATSEALCDWLAEQPGVESVFYPKFTMREAFDEVKRPGGGYGSLFSIVLRNGPVNAPLFYDRLRISKGPSLGNNFSLACPYTLLAHFEELEWAESHGVSRWLVRVSIGLEPLDELKDRFAEALDGLAF
jgi:cystathionine gamma-synthase